MYRLLLFIPVILYASYVEEGYSPLGRSALVDVFLAEPYAMPVYASTLAKARQLESFLGGRCPKPIVFCSSAPEPFIRAFGIEGRRIYSYFRHFQQIDKRVKSLLSVITEEEKEWLRQNYNSFFFGEDGAFRFFTSDNPMPLKFFAIGSRVDLAALAECALSLNLIVDDLRKHPITTKEYFRWEEGGLKLIVSGKDHTTHTESADFFIDAGGHNTIRSGGASLHIDLKGNNTYEGDKFVQGSGFLGIGLLASFGGNNKYTATGYAQGLGFFGVGILLNDQGNNHFELGECGQSCALFGTSILWNKGGGNTYTAKHVGQGASSTLGSAFLIDEGGHNRYQLESFGQGAASGFRSDPWIGKPTFYGGVAYLYNGGGSNFFKGGWLVQGSAYMLGAGLLVSDGAENEFIAGSDSQGQGLHLAAGLFLNRGGHSRFSGGWGSLGVGADRSVGMFIGTQGHNRYEAGDFSLGSARKPKALGIFIDRGESEFRAGHTSKGSIQWPARPIEWPRASFLQRGIRFPNFCLRVPVSRPLTRSPDIKAILRATYDERRRLYESIDLLRFTNPEYKPDLSILLANPATIPEDQFNFAALWAIENDRKESLPEIVRALKSGRLRSRMAITMVGELAPSEADPLLAQLMLTDHSEENRYFAALFLAKRTSCLNLIAYGLKCGSESVRHALLKGLQDRKELAVLPLVTPFFHSSNFYVRRAAAMTAIAHGDKAGIPVFLETLQYPTLDTTENYGENLFVDFLRYAQM